MSRYWKFKSNRNPSWETRDGILWNLEVNEASCLTVAEISDASGVTECDEFGTPLALEKEGER